MNTSFRIRDRKYGIGASANLLSLVAVLAALAIAVDSEHPKSFALDESSQPQIDRKTLSTLDRDRLLAEDRERSKDHPMRFAVQAAVHFTLENSGTWQTLSDGSRLWRLRIDSPGAVNLSLAITRFEMPEGAKLWIYDPSHEEVQGPYTERNRNKTGGLFTPLIRGDVIVVEVDIAAGKAKPTVEISMINQGYRGFGTN